MVEYASTTTGSAALLCLLCCIIIFIGVHLKMVSLIYFIVSEINILIKFR